MTNRGPKPSWQARGVVARSDAPARPVTQLMWAVRLLLEAGFPSRSTLWSMSLQDGVFNVTPQDFSRAVDVWEASVRATHDFVTDADLSIFRPMVTSALPAIKELACVRDGESQLAGFVAVVDGKVEMLFLHPDNRGQGGGKRLLEYAIREFAAVELDVNEQNPQAIGFYERMGFDVVGRSERDGTGKPYPILHMRLRRHEG